MAELNRMSNGGRGRKGDGQPLLDDSDSDVQEFALHDLPTHRSPRTRKPRSVHVKKRDGCCRTCSRCMFLVLNIAILACIGFIGYRGWELTKDVEALKKELSSMKDTESQYRLNMEDTVDKAKLVSGLRSKLLEVNKTQTAAHSAMHGEMKAMSEKMEIDIADTRQQFKQRLAALSSSAANDQSQASQSVQSQLGSVRETHAAFASAVARMNSSMLQRMNDMVSDLDEVQSDIATITTTHDEMDAGMRSNMTKVNVNIDSMEADMLAMHGNMENMKTSMNTMTSTMNVMTASIDAMTNGDEDDAMPTLPPIITQAQVALDTVERLNTSLRHSIQNLNASVQQTMHTLSSSLSESVQAVNGSLSKSFQKLVAIVKAEHGYRVSGQKNISMLVTEVQSEVAELGNAVTYMNTTSALLLQELLRPAPTTTTPRLPEHPATEPPQVAETTSAAETGTTAQLREAGFGMGTRSGEVSIASVRSTLSALVGNMTAAQTKISELEADQRLLNSSIFDHRVHVSRRIMQLYDFVRSKTNVSRQLQPAALNATLEELKSVDWGSVMNIYINSGYLQSVLERVNFTAMIPAVTNLTQHLMPVIMRAFPPQAISPLLHVLVPNLHYHAEENSESVNGVKTASNAGQVPEENAQVGQGAGNQAEANTNEEEQQQQAEADTTDEDEPAKEDAEQTGHTAINENVHSAEQLDSNTQHEGETSNTNDEDEPAEEDHPEPSSTVSPAHEQNSDNLLGNEQVDSNTQHEEELGTNNNDEDNPVDEDGEQEPQNNNAELETTERPDVDTESQQSPTEEVQEETTEDRGAVTENSSTEQEAPDMTATGGKKDDEDATMEKDNDSPVEANGGIAREDTGDAEVAGVNMLNVLEFLASEFGTVDANGNDYIDAEEVEAAMVAQGWQESRAAKSFIEQLQKATPLSQQHMTRVYQNYAQKHRNDG
eukprot:scpid27362/ scgid1096/ 